MIPGNINMGQIAGIPIRVHISLPIIIGIVALSTGRFIILPMAVVAAFCILLHELGHSVVAMRRDCEIRQIVLSPIGGVAQIGSATPLSPRNELQVAIAGPVVSFALAIPLLLLGLAGFSAGIPQIPEYVFLFGVINLFYCFFNLLPAFPMDGGRILRALLTPKKGRLESTRIAMITGRVFAVLFFLAGLFWPGDAHWQLMLISFFIYVVAGFEYRMAKAHALLNREEEEHFEETSGLIVGPAPYESPQKTIDNRPRVLRETGIAARIVAQEFARLHKL